MSSRRRCTTLPACRRLPFPFPRATKEIGDVCTQAMHDYDVKFPNLKFNLEGKQKTTEEERELTF